LLLLQLEIVADFAKKSTNVYPEKARLFSRFNRQFLSALPKRANLSVFARLCSVFSAFVTKTTGVFLRIAVKFFKASPAEKTAGGYFLIIRIIRS